jgi:tRNA-splicing endonuclease subunit Sen54
MSLQPDADPDAPSAAPQPLSAARDDDDAAAVGAGSDDGASDPEDDVPDYSQLLALAARARSSAAVPFIPKRGEKDFEPTGFGAQQRALEKSRAAMREAISGERRIGR